MVAAVETRLELARLRAASERRCGQRLRASITTDSSELRDQHRQLASPVLSAILMIETSIKLSRQ